ncbi:MAG: hypothetical protein QMD94_01205 [Candidatus Omnitrophota bacterium]|nr:hypothetical protein [Candidatus Omnitrophota bacterium]
MKTGRIVLATIVTSILKIIWGFLTCGWLFNWVYKLEPVMIWKKPEQMNFGLMNAAEFISVFFWAFFYAIIHKSLPGKGVIKGFWLGLFIWLTATLPGVFITGLCTVMNPTVVIYWIISFLLVSLCQGILIAGIYGSPRGKAEGRDS